MGCGGVLAWNVTKCRENRFESRLASKLMLRHRTYILCPLGVERGIARRAIGKASEERK